MVFFMKEGRLKSMIYLDNAATTIDKDERVARAVYDAIYSRNFANPSRGAYKESLNSLSLLMETRKNVGKLFGMANPLNVVLCPNVTYGLNFVTKALFKKGDHVITSLSEHNSVLRPLYSIDGLDLSFLDLDNFSIKIDSLEDLIKENTKSLVISGASNVSGMITDLSSVHKICQKHGLKLIIDGAQLAGYVDFDISKFPDTIFLFTGHKGLHGPQGTGGFVINGDFDFGQVFSGGSGFDSFSKKQPHVLPDLFEPGTQNVHSFAGLNEAVKILLEKDHKDKLYNLKERLEKGLRDIPGLVFYKDFDKKSVPIVSFNINHMPASEVSNILWEKYKICTRAGSHCAPLFHEKMGTKKTGIVRMSLSFYNSNEEIDKAIEAVREISQ